MGIEVVIKRRDYQEWLQFCDQIQNATEIPYNEPEQVQKARIKRALSDYNFFVKTYLPNYAKADCGYFHLQAADEIKKNPNCFAVLEWPREHAKSVHANIIIPMWLLAHKELTGMLLMGKNETDAQNLLSDLQAQLQYNKLFAYDFGEMYNFGSWETGEFVTKDGIRFKAIGRDQSPRGARKGEKRPNYAVVDDVDDDEIINNPKRVDKVVKRILGALYFALSTKGARMVIAGNRIHSNSILANIVGDTKPGAKKREGIYHSKVFATESKKGVKCYIENGGQPAWKENYTIAELQQKINIAGPTIARQEFYHETAISGKIFKDSYFHFVKAPNYNRFKIIIGYFDPSFENKPTSDYKAIRVWALYLDQYWCLKSFVRRTDLTSCFSWMIQYADYLKKKHGVSMLWYIERQFFNKPIKEAKSIAEKQQKKQLNIITDTTDKENKYIRILKMEPRYYNGQVFYDVEQENDPDMIEGNNQLKGIEPGYNGADDSPDADEGAWNMLSRYLDSNDFTPILPQRTESSAW